LRGRLRSKSGIFSGGVAEKKGGIREPGKGQGPALSADSGWVERFFKGGGKRCQARGGDLNHIESWAMNSACSPRFGKIGTSAAIGALR